jgi:hypothetical protein
MKKCIKCKTLKSNKEFYKNSFKCKFCVSLYYKLNKDKINTRQRKFYLLNRKACLKRVKNYQKSHPEVIIKYLKEHKLHFKNWCLKRKYGINLEEYNCMIIKQHGRCAICNKKRKLGIDHNHKTKEIRGMLCNQCNQMIGMAYENKNILLKAVKYLSNKRK